MASKYDDFWGARLDDIRATVERASHGAPSKLSVHDLAVHGERSSWYGTVTVRGQTVLGGSMAHAVALGRLVAAHGLCRPIDATFRFTIGTDLVLTVELDRVDRHPPSSQGRDRRAAHTGAIVPSHAPAGLTNKPGTACARIHQLLESLPVLDRPELVPFDNGLYFFYERGETSAHGPTGRIVRIGNHPRAADRLPDRLREHYRSTRGAKNWSVFRRYLGGALIRRSDPASPCLSLEPGRGHWERQNEETCPDCEHVEQQVTATLRDSFSLRAIRIDDMQERNNFEARLIATVAACPICVPSDSWLGRV